MALLIRLVELFELLDIQKRSEAKTFFIIMSRVP